ncbi:hypothetical protein [Wenzhouxiangella marina]|nr:hypothetical protein [Wenzhouxiangella marina]MBB6087028.1 hypothetical protein [Wenzhouxiangella marina]
MAANFRRVLSRACYTGNPAAATPTVGRGSGVLPSALGPRQASQAYRLY